MENNTDILDLHRIRENLKAEYRDVSIEIYDSIASTNDLAKEKAREGASNTRIIIANRQESGRGRIGRNFFSPSNSGIYISFLFKANLDMESSVLVTSSVSVALCKAIEKICKKSPKIKWVNDIYLRGKKISGTLTEGITNMKTKTIEYLIIGTGINFQTPKDSFPKELQDIADSIYRTSTEGITRNHLISEYINNILDLSKDFLNKDYLNEYRKFSCILGQDIKIINSNEIAKAIDIDDKGGLVVIKENGARQTLNSGEISIRLKD